MDAKLRPFHTTRAVRVMLFAMASALLTACTQMPPAPDAGDNPLVGRVWDPHGERFVTQESAIARALAAPFVILGEAHDNPEHHRLQAKVLESMLRGGRRPLLAMEQFDHEHQAALDAARARGEGDAERIADAGRFDREGWRWPEYRPLVELALRNDLPLRAANFSRTDARALMRSGRPAPDLPAAPAGILAALAEDIVAGHCGHRPAAGTLSAMVEAQRARDALLAKSLQSTGEAGAVLITGAGHARRDRAAPLYLSAAERDRLLSLAFIEVEPGKTQPRDYVARSPGTGTGPEYDLIWFTSRAPRVDPCRQLRKPLQ